MSSPEFARALEAGGKALIRSGDHENAQVLLAHALLIYQRKREFSCDVDESAGMAEVVELQQWSTKV